MSYLRIDIEYAGDFDLLCENLEALDFFKRTDDWHEKLLKNIDQVGLPRDCHPARSVLRNKEQSGKAYAVDFVLSCGRKLDGQFRPTSLLVSDKFDRSEFDTEDNHIKQFVDALSKLAIIEDIEVA